MKFQILTNNPMVRDELGKSCSVLYLDITYEEVLLKAMELCKAGHRLLTHPLSGSVKPNETPYKSIMIGMAKSDPDLESVTILEKALVTYHKFPKLYVTWSEQTLQDFRLVDYTLISSALDSAAVDCY